MRPLSNDPLNRLLLHDQYFGEALSRRVVLRRAIAIGAALPMSAALLAACGGDDDDDDAPSDSPTAVADEPAAESPTPESAPGDDAPTATEGEEPAATEDDTGGAAQPGGTLVYAVHRDPIGIDPHINFGATSSSVQGNVYDTLVDYDENGEIIPSLAESWENPDDHTFVFYLRQGVTFHDGSPFSADDVIYTFERILDEDTGASRRTELLNMESYEAQDEHTVEIRLKAPYASFLAVLATVEMAIASKAWAEAGGDFTQSMNGTGPFMLQSYEPEVEYIFDRNPNYWRPDLPLLERAELLPNEDNNARINALRSGQVNFAEYIPWQEMAAFDADENFRLYQGFDLFNLVRLNPNRAPLDNKLVRQALNYAVNRDDMIEIAFGGQGLPMDGSLQPQGTFWYNEELEAYWTYDPERAKALLVEAGYSDPSELSLTFHSLAAPGVHGDTALVVLQNLEDLGITMDFQVMGDTATLLEKRQTGDYQMMMDGKSFTLPDPDALTEYFAEGGSQYAAGVDYSNPELDRLLAEGRSTFDRDERKAIYLEAERVLLDDAPWIFLFWRPQAEASTLDVEGYIRVPGLGTHSVAYFERLWIASG